MQFIKRRENDPQYLKNVIAQRQIVIEEEKRKFDELTKHNDKLKLQYEELQKQKLLKEQAAAKQSINLKAAIQHLESEIQVLKEQKNEIQFLLNNNKIKLQEVQREHKSEIERLKDQFDAQKDMLNSKIANLESNLTEIKKYYHIQEKIIEDKKKIIEDSNRDLRGFSNQKQERMLIIQNQQYKHQIQYQSKNLTIQLQRNQKFQEEIKNLRVDLQLHKQIENDLIKRSSLAQTLIKKLYRQIQQLKRASVQSTNFNTQSANEPSESQRSQISRVSELTESQKRKDEIINKLKFEIANLKNEKHYLQSIQKVYSKKYQTLGSLMADYLQNLLYSKDSASEESIQGTNAVTLNIHQLRSKDIKQWSFDEMQTVIHLLITQVKPFISKNSLVNFPEAKNVNVSFIEQAPKELLSLPKISEGYEKAYEKQVKKGQNRFKDIPIDISTKILRSNLRQWGSKIKYGNMPINKNKSKSIIEQNKKSFL